MKKSILAFCATAAALLLAGCQKEIISVVESAEETHTVVFTAEKMVETKTAIASEENGKVSYKWTTGDEARMYITETYTSGENTVTNTGTVTDMTLSNDDKTATFTVSFSGAEPTGTVSYKAAYAGSYSSGHNPLIPSAQAPLPASFDPDADVMVSDVITKTARESSFRFNMIRKVSVNKMTLKGLTPGEKVHSVTFESDKNHSAYYNLADNDYSSPYEKKLTLTYTADNTVPTSGEFPVYFTTAPVTDATFTVTVITDATKYTKTPSSTISFATGIVRRFGVNFTGCGEPIVTGTVYTLVESQEDLISGASYLLVGQADNVWYAMANQAQNNRRATVVARDNNTITIDNSSTAHVFTIESTSDGYTIADNDGAGYLSDNGTSSDNLLTTVSQLDANSYWTITINNGNASDNSATIVNTNNTDKPNLRFNNKNALFACYASGQHPVFLFIDLSTAGNVKQNPNLSFTDQTYEFTYGDADYVAFSGQELTNPNNLTVTWESSNTGLATVNNNGVVSFVENATGETTITASFAGNDSFKAGSASYKITVNPAPSILTLPFEESFTDSDGTMGWSGGAAAGTIAYDNDGWTCANAYGANGSARFGKGSGLGSAQTPEIYYSGNATLTFKAGAWNGNSESTTLKVSLSSGTIYQDAAFTTAVTSVTLSKGAWTEYTLYLKDLTSPFTLKFEGNSSNNSRFFLDDIQIVAGIVQPAPSFNATLTSSDNVPAAGGTKTINITGNVAWTASATNGATVSPASGNGEGAVTVTIPTNTDQTAASYDVTVSTTADVEQKTYTFTVNQDAASSTTPTVHTATINFGNNGTKINKASVTGNDSEGNTWTVTTVGTDSFTPNAGYNQVGSSKKPATSITFTTTLANTATDINLEAKFGGYGDTAGTVNLKVGNNTIGTGSLNGTNDVTVNSTSTASGTVLTVTVTNISKGVKCYYITATYTN